MEFIKGFFREDSKESMMRLAVFIVCSGSILAFLISVVGFLINGRNCIVSAGSVSLSLISAVIIGKVKQKGKEESLQS